MLDVRRIACGLLGERGKGRGGAATPANGKLMSPRAHASDTPSIGRRYISWKGIAMTKKLCLAGLMLTLLLLAPGPAVTSPVDQARAVPLELAQLIDRADKVVVSGDTFSADNDGSSILFESSNRQDLDALRNALQVERPKGNVVWTCLCSGYPAIFLYDHGKQIGRITYHHGKTIRCHALWASDATIIDVETSLKWFDDRKIPEPRKEYERIRAIK
jgi:hypothetical protein